MFDAMEESLRIVIIATGSNSLESCPADRSRNLHIELLENGIQPVAVLPADPFLSERLAQLHADLVVVDAESDAAELLSHLGVKEELHSRLMKELTNNEKVRVLLAQAIFGNPDVLILDEPTNHLDMESITALNDGMSKFKGNIIFTSHDHQLMQTVANRIIDIRKDKIIDREITYNEYLGIE